MIARHKVSLIAAAVGASLATARKGPDVFALDFEFVPGSHCFAVGRPVLDASQLQAHSVGVGGAQDVIWGPLYDSQSYASAGATQLSFFALPQGQGVASGPGAGGGAKTLLDTNLVLNNQLAVGNEFYAIGSETIFMPGVQNSTATPFALLPGRNAFTATTLGSFTNDMWEVGAGGLKVLAVGTDRKYIQDGPLNLFPPATRMAGWAAMGSLNSATATTYPGAIEYAQWSGEPYTLVPIYIQSNQQFQLTITYAFAIATPSQQIGRMIERLRGYLIRQAT